MLLPDIEVLDRVSSHDNLINRLRVSPSSVSSLTDSEKIENEKESLSETDLAVVSRILHLEGVTSSDDSVSKKTESPKIDDLVPDALDKIKVNLAQTTALDVVNDSLAELRNRLCEVGSPKDLSKIASDASKIISNLQPKNKDDNKKQGSVIIYKPAVAELSSYTVVKANE